jgi:8-oxo-dGTP pyrophosphatase MutT (NUDIX family)
MPMSEYMTQIRRKVGRQLLEVPSVSIIARDSHGRVLLVRHAEIGSWMTPGGAIEPNETPANAAVREMWEETGLDVRLTRLAGVYGGPEFVVRYQNGDENSYVMIVFEAEILAGEARPDDEEILEVSFFERSELDSLEMPAWMSEVLQGVLEGGEHAGFRPATWRSPAAV